MSQDQKIIPSGRLLGKNGSLSIVMIMSGAIAAFTIGSGFATGQEVLQYFASYGFWGIFGTGTVLLLMLVLGFTIFAKIGNEQQFEKPTEIFHYLGGKFLGTLLDYFYIVFMFLLFTMMIAGGGALFEEHYGISGYLGGLAVAIVVSATAWFGLRNLIGIIGRIGPLIVLVAIALGTFGVLNGSDGLTEGHLLVADLEMIRASSHWLPAGISYSGVVIMMLAPFVAALGKRVSSRKLAIRGGAMGGIMFTAGCIIVGLGLLANISRVYNVEIPLMVLARDLNPLIASLISVVILAGIYTTAVPLLWAVASRFYDDTTTGFKIVTIVTAVIGSVIGLLVPFAELVNWIFSASGYVGVFVFLLALAHSVVRRFRPDKSSVSVGAPVSAEEQTIDAA